MNNRDLEKKIRSSYDNIAPDILESVLSDCDTQKGHIIVMKEEKKKVYFTKYIAALAAVLLLVIGGSTYMNDYRLNHTIASTIMLDVNPSIEILVNKNEKVLEVVPLNEDAKVIVGDMDFSGSSVDVTVNALIGSMLRNGYISNQANSILVTVNSDDEAFGQQMQTKLMSEIDSILASGNISGAVLGQTNANDSETEQLAEQYGITTGKAKLIHQITQQNTFYSFEDLVCLTINELNVISETNGMSLENIDSIGNASTSAYIGEQAAKDIAFAHAGVKAKDTSNVKCELDWENGMMIYEIEFDANGYEYEYEINAKTGEITDSDKEKDDDYVEKKTSTGTTKKTTSTTYIGKAKAKAIALKHAGVKESAIHDYSCELDKENGIMVYEIEFEADGYEYEYEINAKTGAVVKYEKEKD